MNNRPFGRIFLLLNFLVDDTLPEGGIELLKLDLALNFLLVLAAPADVVGLRRAEFYKAIL
jgi:hypothetical protein